MNIKSENLWNLIEEEKIYLVSYGYKDLKNGAALSSIKIPK